MARSPLLMAKSDAQLLRTVVKDAQDVTEKLEENKPEDVRIPLFFEAHVYEIQARLQEEGLDAHPLFRPYVKKLARLSDAEADDVFTFSRAIRDVSAPPEVEREFGSVSQREKGTQPPPNPYREITGTASPRQLIHRKDRGIPSLGK